MYEFNTKITLNGKIFHIHEKLGEKCIDDKLFYKFIDSAKSFTLNDNGAAPEVNYTECAGLKGELKNFDISLDKDLGHEWEFEVNDNSRALIIKAFEAYKPIAHTKWTLRGSDFRISYIEADDMYDLMGKPPCDHVIITAKGSALENINSIFQYCVLN